MTVVDHKEKIRDVLICFQNILEVYSGPTMPQDGGGIKIELKARDVAHHLSDWGSFTYADKYFKKNEIKLFQTEIGIHYLMSDHKIEDSPRFHELAENIKEGMRNLIRNPVIGSLYGESVDCIQKTIKKLLTKFVSENQRMVSTYVASPDLQAGNHFELVKKEGSLIVQRDVVISKLTEKQLKIGPLKYKGGKFFCNDVLIVLRPQEEKILFVLMEASIKNATFVSDERLKESLIKFKSISTLNLQKLMSKIRKTLEKIIKGIEIKRINQEGYILVTKKIR